ncbi:putative nucleic acid-binding protein [Rosa chinensis]|uniref:Putative nucleic acid-binding protein n=1 Tax=Rosa chinensis TaxID=74649 RepID=A0A2P6RHR7_ROSCH|nr:aminoacyl tRNA synthase complex-interacting multifunctional protein 1 [Rosa chinensis]PRQ45985.1 putative nucleic acid-binding protein [Rosa chinensis]
MAANVLKCGTGIGARLIFLSPSPKSPRPFGHSLAHFHQITANSYRSICSKPKVCDSAADASSPSARRRSVVSSFCAATDVEKAQVEAEAISDGDEEQKKIKDAADLLDIRVGLVLRAWRHEEADSLYVEEVDIGEPEPRIICSGLVNYIPIDHIQERKVVVLANLKPRNMRGVKSCGMLMAASDASHENVELLVPPEGSLPGQRIWFGSEDDHQNQPPPATPNQIQKKKIWELVQPHLKTDDTCMAMLGMHIMRTSAGVIISRSLKHANIS